MSGLQDQRAAFAIARKQTEGALNMGIPGQPGETSVKVRDDDLAIVNRSPTTHIVNNHGIPGWSILAVILLIALAVGAWLYLSRPVSPPDKPSPPTASTGEEYKVEFWDP